MAGLEVTAIAKPTVPREVLDEPAVERPAPAPVVTAAKEPARPTLPPLRVGRLIVGWIILSAVGIVLVLTAVGPLAEQRDQRRLLDDYRVQIESASNQAFGLDGLEVPTEAPSRGAPVAIVDIGEIDLRRVVVEGTEPSETRQGPGHVVGTGGPGQPGNSVIVGRHGLFGGAFADLDDLEVGDEILVSTVQGQSLYVVDHVGPHAIASEDSVTPDEEESTTPTTMQVVDTGAADDDADSAEADAATEDATAQDATAQDATAQDATAQDATAQDATAQDATAQDATAQDATAQDATAQDATAQDATAQDATAQDATAQDEDVVLPDGPVTPDQLFGATNDDRLTLVTSASSAPWSADEAFVVVARMEGAPFTPTPQGGRTAEDDGRQGANGVSASLILAVLAYVLAVVGAVWLHRHVPWRSAYLLSAPLLVALTIVLAEQLAATVPAWS